MWVVGMAVYLVAMVWLTRQLLYPISGQSRAVGPVAITPDCTPSALSPWPGASLALAAAEGAFSGLRGDHWPRTETRSILAGVLSKAWSAAARLRHTSPTASEPLCCMEQFGGHGWGST